jgi:hypothetical protein
MRNESFTVKEIAGMTGVSEQDVLRLIEKIAISREIGELGIVKMVGDIHGAFFRKILQGNSARHPLRFNPVETLMIIEAGLRKDYPIEETDDFKSEAEAEEYFVNMPDTQEVNDDYNKNLIFRSKYHSFQHRIKRQAEIHAALNRED